MTETDAISELQAASDATPSSSADERAANEMQEMQAAIDAERAERAAQEAQAAPSKPTAAPRPERLNLAVRTSLICEYRDSGGYLQAFEVCRGASFGTLCAALCRMPGLVFADHQPGSWRRPPSRFSFRGQVYEVGLPHENLRVVPVNQGEAVPEMQELLEYVRVNVLKSQSSQYVTMERSF